MNTNTIIGYRVKNNHGEYLAHTPEQGDFVTETKPEPISKGDAYRRLAAYFDAPQCDDHHVGEDFYVTPVFYEPTPLEKAGAELGGLLESLCQRHGVNLGLTREQINAKLAAELAAIAADGNVGGLIVGLPRPGR
jgi:hypothetical protein